MNPSFQKSFGQSKRRFHPSALLSLVGFSALSLAGGTADAAITVLGTGSAVTAANSGPGEFTLTNQGAGNRDGIYSYSFAAGATSDMLVVSISTEASSEAWSVSYAGTAMTLATQSSVGSGTSIFYLANPSASGSIAIDFTGKSIVNGIGLGIASLSGGEQAIAFDKGVSSSSTESIGITTAFANSFVMFAGDANATAGANPSLNSPLTTIFDGPVDIGSNQAAAGYANGVSSGAQTYSWNVPVVDAERGISVAAFYAVPEPSSALLAGGLVGLGLLRRRRGGA